MGDKMNKMKKYILVNLIVLLVIAALSIPVNQVFGQGGVTVFSNLRITGFYRAQPRTALTVTMNGTINSTGTYQRLTAAGAVSVSGDNVTIKPAGTILTLVNAGAQTITITETANIKSAGNLVLGTLDTATLISDGSDWYQLAGSNN
jgi:hypothetical protein